MTSEGAVRPAETTPVGYDDPVLPAFSPRVHGIGLSTVERRSRLTLAALAVEAFTRRDGVELELCEPRKHAANPLLPRDAAWDRDSNDHYFGQIVRDVDNGSFHLWHTAAILGPGKVFERNLTTYAFSGDGIRWTRPSLGRVAFEGSLENSIVTVAHEIEHHGIAGFFEDPNESDPARRYKRVYPRRIDQSGAREDWLHGLFLATSPDLVHWVDAPENPIASGQLIADTLNHAFWDPQAERYVAITRAFVAVRGEMVRAVARVESPDCRRWGPLETVFYETEPGATGRQFYAMSTFPYAGGYAGLVYVFHSNPVPENDNDSVMDVELAWSPDSVEWHLVDRGRPLIPRGEPGAFDHGRIFALPGPDPPRRRAPRLLRRRQSRQGAHVHVQRAGDRRPRARRLQARRPRSLPVRGKEDRQPRDPPRPPRGSLRGPERRCFVGVAPRRAARRHGA